MSSRYTVAKTFELADGQGRAFSIPGSRKSFALFRWADQFFAVTDECPHANASLSEGKVNDFLVTCPAHGAQFDIRSGQAMSSLAYSDLRTLNVQIVGDDVQVEF